MHDSALLVLGGVFGALIGSFLNVVISRGPRAWGLVTAEGLPKGLAFPPSQCEACHLRLRPIELVPILSYVLQRGQCRSCREPIGMRHLLVELLGALLGMLAWLIASGPLSIIALGILFAGLLTLAVIDAETGFLPDMLTIPLAALGLSFSFAGFPPSPLLSFLGVLIGGGGLWLIGTTYERVRGREGLGGGDVKLVAAAGAWCGALALPFLLLIASAGGLLFAGVMMAAGRKERALSAELRFGPFLCAATAITYGCELLGVFAVA